MNYNLLQQLNCYCKSQMMCYCVKIHNWCISAVYCNNVCFDHCAPKAWNNLHNKIRSFRSLGEFKSVLFTFYPQMNFSFTLLLLLYFTFQIYFWGFVEQKGVSYSSLFILSFVCCLCFFLLPFLYKLLIKAYLCLGAFIYFLLSYIANEVSTLMYFWVELKCNKMEVNK